MHLPLTSRAIDIANLFDLDLERAAAIDEPPCARDCIRIAESLELAPATVTFVGGPSGGGKSTLISHCAARLRDRDKRTAIALSPALVSADDEKATPIVDLLKDAPLDEALRTLARAGLAEAALLVRPAASLSEGERARLLLALAMHHGQQHADHASRRCPVIVADEFCTPLDRITAESVARAAARWVRTSGCCALLAATAHGDVTAWLEPDVHIETTLAGAPELLGA